MPFLAISIIAAIILVAVVIRRLPYLRTHKLGLEITTPRPYIAQASKFQDIWYQITSWFQSLRLPKTPSPRRSGMRPLTRPLSENVELMNPNYQAPRMGEGLSTTAYPDGTFASEVPAAITATSVTEAPHPFWEDDEPAKGVDPLELPTKGLVTRRGESQKIAHELITHADAAFRKKEYKEAEKYYLQAATKDPDNARIYNRLGVIYLRTKNYKDAIEAFRGSIKFDDRVASRHYNLALAYLGKRDYRSAEKGLHEAIRLEPTNEKYRQTLDAITK